MGLEVGSRLRSYFRAASCLSRLALREPRRATTLGYASFRICRGAGTGAAGRWTSVFVRVNGIVLVNGIAAQLYLQGIRLCSGVVSQLSMFLLARDDSLR